MNTNDKCKNCGGDRGIHHYQTMQCPVGGREAPGTRKQEYMTLTFQPDEPDKSDELIEAVNKLAASIEKLIEIIEAQDAYDWTDPKDNPYLLQGEELKRAVAARKSK